jgi:malonyl-CoA/methylmalonyl-CoA synthetase
MNLPDLFNPSLRDAAQRVGLEFSGREYTFGDLEQASNRIAHLFRADGFQPGDRVAVYLQNCVELIHVYLACVKLGLVFVPINILYRGREIEFLLNDAEPTGLVIHAGCEDDIAAAAKTVPAIKIYAAEELHDRARNQPAERPQSTLDGDSAAVIVYTSGTTGRSKGAVLTHANFAANAQNLIACWRMESNDRLLLALPLFHVHGLGNGLHTWLACGFLVRLLERFRKETIAEEFLDFGPTVFFGVPAMYERLLDVEPDTARRIGGFMRLFASGSAPLPAATLDRFQKLYGHVILERYGMSETLMNTSNPYDGERRPGSVGVAMPDTTIRIADPSTGVEARDGEAGELLVKGPNVFRGYWRQPEITRQSFTEDGFFRTGDLATRSTDGYYTLAGRKHDLIISGGFNIYPREIEEFLEEQPEVAEAAIASMPDRVRGEIPVAYVVLREGQALDAETLRSRCAQHLASFKVPRRFVALESLPRNALGKVQRHRLPGAEPGRKL